MKPRHIALATELRVTQEVMRGALAFGAELWSSPTEAAVLGRHWQPGALVASYAIHAQQEVHYRAVDRMLDAALGRREAEMINEASHFASDQ
jgi:hypothetical protein